MSTPWNLFNPISLDGNTIENVFLDLQGVWDSISSEFTTDRIRVSGSPRPELLSDQVYGSSAYWWIILVINEVVDPFNDWPKDVDQLRAWCFEKYDDPEAIRHYEHPTTGRKYFDIVKVGASWYDSGDPGGIQDPIYTGDLLPVTFLEWESRLNDDRRTMEFVVPSQIRTCAERFYEELNGD